jgi:hypothetical protein
MKREVEIGTTCHLYAPYEKCMKNFSRNAGMKNPFKIQALDGNNTKAVLK